MGLVRSSGTDAAGYSRHALAQHSARLSMGAHSRCLGVSVWAEGALDVAWRTPRALLANVATS